MKGLIVIAGIVLSGLIGFALQTTFSFHSPPIYWALGALGMFPALFVATR